MDNGHQRSNGRHRVDIYKGAHAQPQSQPHPHAHPHPHSQSHPSQWNMLAQHSIYPFANERDMAIKDRDRALAEKKAALEERDLAIQQRDTAILERDNAFRERDNAIAALRFQESTMNSSFQRTGTTKRAHNQRSLALQVYKNERDTQSQDQIFEAFPLSTVIPEKPITKPKRKKVNKSGPGPGPGSGSGSGSGTGSCSGRSSKRGKKVGEDLNRQVTTDGSKAEWDAQELGLMHEVSFDESTMPIPICSCTGVARQCYKWGSGGWQSACCTTNISVYPLPQMENKRHARMGGRKMSGSVFTRLLSRLAAQGHDLSAPLDLKNYWAKHGTNRYITIK